MSKRITCFFGTLSSLILCASAWAAPQPQNAVVRVSSAPCGSTTGLTGSGVLLTIQDQTYVLSSASVVLDDPSACTVIGFGSASAPAKLLAHDWAHGVALLQLSQALPGTAPLSASDIATAPATTGDSTISIGFASTDSGESVLMPQSDRHYFVLVSSALEVVNAKIDPTMVGGGSFNSSGELIGLLSDQYLKMIAGRPTRPYLWDSVAGHVETQPLLIPASDIQSWLQNYFANPSGFQPVVTVDPKDQLAGTDRVSIRGLTLESTCPAPQASYGALLRGIFFGGGDGTGIGGGDGTGIGGDSPEDPACRIGFTQNTAAQMPEFPEAVDFDQLRSRLSSGKAATFLYFAQRDSFSGALSAAVVRSNAEYLTRVFKGGWFSVFSYTPDLTAPAGSALQNAQSISRTILKTLQQPPISGEDSLASDTGLIDALLFSDHPGLLRPSDIDALTDPNGSDSDSWMWIAAMDSHAPSTAFHLGDFLRTQYANLKAALSQMGSSTTALAFRAPASAPSLSPWVVKLTSESSDQKTLYHGSGILFQDGGNAYVLTSDHVVLHSNDGYVHSISSATIPEQKATYLIADWGYGLALLQVPGLTPTSDWPTTASFADPQAGAKVNVLGFPWTSQVLVQNGAATVADPASAQYFFVQVPNLLELGNGLGEYGMSGGPVTSQNGQIIGILSDQKLETDNGTVQNQIFAIPGGVAGAWTKRYLANPSQFALTFFQTVENQTPDGLIASGRFWYNYFAGDSMNSANVEVFAQTNSFTSVEYEDANGWLDGFAKLSAGRGSLFAAEISEFDTGSILTGTQGGGGVTGLVPFFRSLQVKGLIPLGVIQSTDDWTQDLDAAKKIADQINSTASSIITPTQDLPPVLGNLSYALNELVTIFQDASDDGDDEDGDYNNWQSVSSRDVRALVTDPSYQDAWSALQTSGYVNVQDLQNQLNQLADQMEKLVY